MTDQLEKIKKLTSSRCPLATTEVNWLVEAVEGLREISNLTDMAFRCVCKECAPCELKAKAEEKGWLK